LTAWGDLVRGNIEIHEIHRSFFALIQNQRFDLNGFPNYGLPLGDDSLQVAKLRSWVDAMSSADKSSSHSSSASPSRGRSHTRNSNRSSPYPRPQSSSPSFRAMYQREISPGTAREQFIHRLCIQGNILGTTSLWLPHVKADWNASFLDKGAILFPDNRTQIRL